MTSLKSFLFLFDKLKKFCFLEFKNFFLLASYFCIQYAAVPYFIVIFFEALFSNAICSSESLGAIFIQLSGYLFCLICLSLISSLLIFNLEIKFREYTYFFYLSNIFLKNKGYLLRFSSDISSLDQRIIQENEEIIRTGIPLFFQGIGSLIRGFLSLYFVVSIFKKQKIFLFSFLKVNFTLFLCIFFLMYVFFSFFLFSKYAPRGSAILNNWDDSFANLRNKLISIQKNSTEIILLGGEQNELDSLFDISEFFTNILSAPHVFNFFSSFISEIMYIRPAIPFLLLGLIFEASSFPLESIVPLIIFLKSVDQIFFNFFKYISSFWKISVLDNSCLRVEEIDSFLQKERKTMFFNYSENKKKEINFKNLKIFLPSRALLLSIKKLIFSDKTLIIGKSGTGKSTLLKTIWKLWLYGSGDISIGVDYKKKMYVPQKPYLPVATLFYSIKYPYTGVSKEEVIRLLNLFKLSYLVPSLDICAPWSKELSYSEQNIINFIKIFLCAPDLVLCDEITAHLSKEQQKFCFDLLTKSFPDLQRISIGHKKTLFPYYSNIFLLENLKLKRIK